MTDLTQSGPLRTLALVAALGTLAWGVTRVLPPSFSVSFAVVAVVVTVLEAEASWQLVGRSNMPRRQVRAFRLGELALGFVAVQLGHLLFELPGDGRSAGFFDSETVVVWLICIGAWLFATASIGDLERLGDPRERSINYRPPLDALTGRFLAGGVLLVAVGAVALVGLANVADVARAPDAGWFWPAALYFAVGFAVLGLIRLQDTERQWQREGMTVAREVTLYWRAGLTGVLLLAALSALLVPLLRAGRLLGFAFQGMVDFVVWSGGLLGLRISAPDRPGTGGSEAIPVTPTTIPEVAEPGETSSLIQEIVQTLSGFGLILVLALLALAVIRLLMSDRFPVGGLLSSGVGRGLGRLLWLLITGLPRIIAWALRSLWAWFRRVTTVELEGEATPAKRAVTDPALVTTWGEADTHRREIAALYRRFLEIAGDWIRPRRISETPSEYGRQVVMSAEQTRTSVDSLTADFNEARYSRHDIGPDHVTRVTEALTQFEDLSSGEVDRDS